MCVIYSLKSKLSSSTIIRKIFYEWGLSNWQSDAFAIGFCDPAVVAAQKQQRAVLNFPGLSSPPPSPTPFLSSLFPIPLLPSFSLPPSPSLFLLGHVIQLWEHCVWLKLGPVWGCSNLQPTQHLGVMDALPCTLTMAFEANVIDSHRWNVGSWSHKGRWHKGRIFRLLRLLRVFPLSAGTLCGALCNGMDLGANWSPALAPWRSQSLNEISSLHLDNWFVMFWG